MANVRRAGIHLPVMLAQVIAALRPSQHSLIIDCTYGRGGHTSALLSALGPAGRVIALDRDPEAVSAGRQLSAKEPRLHMVHAPFSRIHAVAAEHGVTGKVTSVLFDLGVSSPQLEDPKRGFSFQYDGPLDMRMDTGSQTSAADWIAVADEHEIAQVLWRFGEERFSRRVARAICAARERQPIRTTRELAEIVEAAVPRSHSRSPKRGAPRIHPATRTFQAIRIAVNDELGELKSALEQTVEVLAPGGRLAAISFHSLEDRTVKRFMRRMARGEAHPEFGFTGDSAKLTVVGRPQRPTDEEVAQNPRARSAVLRVAERRP